MIVSYIVVREVVSRRAYFMTGHVNKSQSVPLALVSFFNTIEIDRLCPFEMAYIGDTKAKVQ